MCQFDEPGRAFSSTTAEDCTPSGPEVRVVAMVVVVVDTEANGACVTLYDTSEATATNKKALISTKKIRPTPRES